MPAPRPKFLSAQESWDIEAITEVEALIAKAGDHEVIGVHAPDLAKLVRLAKIGIEAERLFNALRPRDEA